MTTEAQAYIKRLDQTLISKLTTHQEYIYEIQPQNKEEKSEYTILRTIKPYPDWKIKLLKKIMNWNVKLLETQTVEGYN